MTTALYTANDTDLSTDADDAGASTQPAAAPGKAHGSRLALDDIIERDDYTRDLDPAHVESLKVSIAAIGMEQPLVLDTRDRLLAGRHRLHALRALRDEDAERFEHLFPDGRVPARVFDISGADEAAMVLVLELTENHVRRDYTGDEVRRSAEKLKRVVGVTSKRGRPAKGELAIGPILARRFGISLATVRRALADPKQREKVSGDTITELRDAKPSYEAATGAEVHADQAGARIDEQPDVVPSTIAEVKIESEKNADQQPQPMAVDRLAEAKRAVVQLANAEFGEFCAWLSEQHKKRYG